MSEFLVVRLPDSAADASWVVLDGSGHKVTQTERGPLESSAGLAESRKVMLLVDGLSVTMTTASVPVKGQARLLKMLPFALEDSVAEDVGNLHFCPGPRSEDGRTSVAIVERQKLDDWLARCEEVGLAPALVYADTDGVPETPGNLTLVVEGSRVYGRMPDQPPFVLENFSLAEVLDVLTHGDEDLSGLHVVVYADEAGHARCAAEIDAQRLRVASLDLKVLPEGPLPRFGASLVNHAGSNLRQGAYAPKSNWASLLPPWRLAAILLLAFVVAATAVEGVRYFALSSRDAVLTAQLETQCRDALQAPQLAACSEQIQRRLAATGAGPVASSGPVFLEALSALAAAGSASGRIEALSFRNGVTDLRLVVPDVPTLDNMRLAMQESGRFHVVIQSATPGSEGVEGRLQIVETDR